MSITLDNKIKETGTRFLIYPQPAFLNNSEPEIVTISLPPSQIQAGPSDSRMHVVDYINKTPYSDNFPPYKGKINKQVEANTNGHFDHLKKGTREFSCSTMYATVRRVLDIWEDYFGQPIPWYFESSYEKLELIPLVEWDNAQSGYGFLEFGYSTASNGTINHNLPYCEHFDVLAHELGHTIIGSTVGTPVNETSITVDYWGMHESSGDLIALISFLHFDSVVDRLLKNTKGNLFTVNELDRIGELSANEQARLAFNTMRMSDVGEEPHDRSVPLTGAIFDVLVEVFQKKLVSNKLITQELADRSVNNINNSGDVKVIQTDFEAFYTGNEDKFKECLFKARDYIGYLLAETWKTLNPNNLTYSDILKALFNTDRKITNGDNQKTIRECFQWREITPSFHSILFKPNRLKTHKKL